MITSLLRRTLDHARSNVIAYLALFVALGGSSYAALRPAADTAGVAKSKPKPKPLAANSVGTKQLKNGAVTASKLNVHVISLFKGQTGPPGPQGAQGSQGPPGGKGDPGNAGTGSGGTAYPQDLGSLFNLGPAGAVPPSPTGTLYIQTFTVSSPSTVIVSGTALANLQCASGGSGCTITDAGTYIDGQGVPGTDVAANNSAPLPQTVPAGMSAASFPVTANGFVNNVGPGTHTLTIGFTGSGGSFVGAAITDNHGYVLVIPNGS